MLFVILPEVKTCCCYCSIKRGTVIIAVYYMILTVGKLAMNLLDSQADSCYKGANNEMCQFYPVWRCLKYVQLFTFFFVFIVSGTLIIGVVIESHKIISVYMYVVTIMVVVDSIIDVYIFGIVDDLPNCGLPLRRRIFCITLEVILKILFFYFLIVVKSYRSTLIQLRRRQKWRSALSLIARRLSIGDRFPKLRKRHSEDNEQTSQPFGSTSGASTSRPDERLTPTNQLITQKDGESTGISEGVTENVNQANENVKNLEDLERPPS